MSPRKWPARMIQHEQWVSLALTKSFVLEWGQLRWGGTNLKLQRRGNHGELEIDGAVTVRERDLITDRIPIDLSTRAPLGPPGTSLGMSDPAPLRSRLCQGC